MAETAAEAIFHPVRMRIITALSRRQWTTAQIAAALPDVPQATLYRHLKRLLNTDVICVVEQRPVHGVVEKVYALSGGILLTPESPGISQMKPDDWRRAFAAYTASLMSQFEGYLQPGHVDMVKDGLSFRTTPLYLSDDEMAQFFADLSAVVVSALANDPSPNRRRRLFSTVLVPEANLDLNEETGD